MSDRKRKIREFMNSSPEQIRQQINISDQKIGEKNNIQTDMRSEEKKQKTKHEKIMEFLNTDEGD